MAENGPSEKAVQAAAKFACPDPDHGDVSLSLKAAHDPALGLDRSVCLRAYLDDFIGPSICSAHRNREGGDDCRLCNPPSLHDLITEHRRIEQEQTIRAFTESSSPDREGA